MTVSRDPLRYRMGNRHPVLALLLFVAGMLVCVGLMVMVGR